MKKILFLLLSVITLSLSANASIPCYLPSSGLVAYYPFTRLSYYEGYGNLTDSSGNGYHASCDNFIDTNDRHAYYSDGYTYYEENSACFHFRDHNAVTLCPGPTSNNDRSLSFWFKYNTNTSRMHFLSYGTNGSSGRYFSIYLDSNSRISIGDLVNTSVTYNAIPSTANWHHLVITYSSSFGSTYSACKAYLDNNLLSIYSTTNPTQTINTGSGNIITTRTGSTSQFFIDDIAIYNRALSTTEIGSIYNSNQTVASITGASSVNVGTSITLSNSVGGGTWVSNNTARATVSTSGIVTGISAGAVTISYIVYNSCGTNLTTRSLAITTFNAPRLFNSNPTNTWVCKNQSRIISDNIRIVDIDTGQNITWSLHSAPRHGYINVNHTMTNTGGILRPTNKSYIPDSEYIGNDTFIVKITDGVYNIYQTIYVDIRNTPSIPTITGDSIMNRRGSITLTASTTDGTWVRNTSNLSVSNTGIVTSITSGTIGFTDYVTYYTAPNTNGCKASARHYIRVRNTARKETTETTNELRELSNNVYPNPTTGIININTNENSIIRIANISGEIITTLTSNTNTQIDLSNYSNNIYIVSIITTTTKSDYKIIKY